jgi:hypothetical protein
MFLSHNSGMPPRRSAMKFEQLATSEDSDSEYSAADHRAALLGELPTADLLTHVVGIATTLSARIAALSYKDFSSFEPSVEMDGRVIRDCEHVALSALELLGPAVSELVDITTILQATLESLSAALADIPPPAQRSRRRRFS